MRGRDSTFAPWAQAAVGTCNTGNLIDVEATTGTASAGYATLSAAFAAINAGTHRGTITVEVCGDTTEPGAGAILNASGSGSASYATIVVKPVGGVARTITGNTNSGKPTIDLNGADNVTIDGDDPSTPGINRDLTIANTAAASVAATSVIRIATSTAVTSARRSAGAPDVPTMAESGIPGYETNTWNSLVAPRGTPQRPHPSGAARAGPRPGRRPRR